MISHYTIRVRDRVTQVILRRVDKTDKGWVVTLKEARQIKSQLIRDYASTGAVVEIFRHSVSLIPN